jgi:UDP-N-acetylmuramoyl-L-alanyl-D-glutamate--2,6-diaminopimelate ligase
LSFTVSEEKVDFFTQVIKPLKVQGRLTDLKGLCYDSRRLQKGEVFFCLPGLKTDGHIFAQEALRKGAAGIVVERWLRVETPFQALVENSREALATASAVFFDYPSKSFYLIGVTGTNGKTTTTYLLESIFKQAGLKSGLVGTVGCRVGEKPVQIERTTPESLDLQKVFSQMRAAEVEAVAMEVSSHAIHQKRIAYTDFNSIVFTNLSQDHLDYHQTLEEYFEAKKDLFELYPQADHIINIDDPWGRQLVSLPCRERLTFGWERGDVRIVEATNYPEGLKLELVTPSGSFKVEMKIKGSFNAYNAMAATAAACLLGLSLEDIKKGLESLESVPGRFEPVEEGQDFLVLVDYAHTPDGLEHLLRSARELTSNQLIVVFGCGGDRDKTKRPLMGKIAAELADFVFVTSDNPRSEVPERIIKEIVGGIDEVRGFSNFQEVVDRREAIKAALKMAGRGDTVVIAGKGHEDYQEFAGKKVPFDDRQVARALLRSLRRSG